MVQNRRNDDRENPLSLFQRIFYMHQPTDMIAYILRTAFVTSVVEHWLGRAVNPLHHERTL